MWVVGRPGSGIKEAMGVLEAGIQCISGTTAIRFARNLISVEYLQK